MLDHDDARAVEAVRVGDLARERREGLRRDDDRRRSRALELDEVVDTPRRARSSIG